jgi:hypothetical protein
VKEFVFRVNMNSSLEIAAKALAKKNEHDWHEYSFSHIDSADNERRFEDLATRFDAIACRAEGGSELILFYRAGKNMIERQKKDTAGHSDNYPPADSL